MNDESFLKKHGLKLALVLVLALTAVFAYFVWPIPQIMSPTALSAEIAEIPEEEALLETDGMTATEALEECGDVGIVADPDIEGAFICTTITEVADDDGMTATEALEECGDVGIVADANIEGAFVCTATTEIAEDNGDQRSEGPQGPEDRVEFMIELDNIFDTQGAGDWLEAAGMPYDWAPNYFDAREPQGETLALSDGSTKVVVSGMQVNVSGLYVPYPACFTTDQPSRATIHDNTRQYTPDPENGSTLYTNATTAGNGEVTVWVDCSNWGQLDPTE